MREGEDGMEKAEKTVSIQTLKRLPAYLNYLTALPKDENANISAKAIAEALSLGEIQVRKDLAAVSDGGRPKVGYGVQTLIADLEAFLGYHDVSDAVLVGAGKLGRALLSYEGFQSYGLNIVAGFDTDAREGATAGGKPIFPMEKLPDLVTRLNIRIGIITAPAEAAQEVCDLLTTNGVLAIWNFAPAHLNAQKNILVRNENMAASLAMLRKHLDSAMQ